MCMGEVRAIAKRGSFPTPLGPSVDLPSRLYNSSFDRLQTKADIRSYYCTAKKLFRYTRVTELVEVQNHCLMRKVEISAHTAEMLSP